MPQQTFRAQLSFHSAPPPPSSFVSFGKAAATTRLLPPGPHPSAPRTTTNTKNNWPTYTHTLKVVKQSDTCSASSLAGSRMIATGVRLPAPPWSRGGAASLTWSVAACSGEANATGVAPRDPAKGVVKSNDACKCVSCCYLFLFDWCCFWRRKAGLASGTGFDEGREGGKRSGWYHITRNGEIVVPMLDVVQFPLHDVSAPSNNRPLNLDPNAAGKSRLMYYHTRAHYNFGLGYHRSMVSQRLHVRCPTRADPTGRPDSPTLPVRS